MSGHGGFSVIGSGMPRPLSVNPEPVEVKKAEVRPKDTGDLKPPAQGRLEQETRMLDTLDALLLQAARTASRPMEAKALKTASTEAKLDKATRRAIEAAAKQADTAFKAINQFTGRQIAEAMKKDENGVFDWDLESPAGAALKAALDAQAELSEVLRGALNHLPAKATAAAQSALEEAMLQTDRRAAEIQTLFCEFADLAETGKDAPEVAARLGRTLESLIPSQSLKMHGNEKIAADFRAALAPLARRIDGLAAGPERQIASAEATKIQRTLDEASHALAGAGQSHRANGVQLDQTLMAAVNGVLEGFRARLANIRREAAMTSMRNFVEKTFQPPPVGLLQERFLPIMKAIFPALTAAVQTQKLLKQAVDDFLAKPNGANLQRMQFLARELAALDDAVSKDLKKLNSGQLTTTTLFLNFAFAERDDLDKLIATLPRRDQKKLTPELIAAFREEVEKSAVTNKERDVGALKVAYGGVGGIATQIEHLVEMYRSAGGRKPEEYLTSKTLRAAFEGRMAVTTLIETRMSGLPDEDAAPALDDSNSVSSKPLGSGMANTVYEVGYKDGSTFIFKPEAPGRQGLHKLQLSRGSYQGTQLVAQLNMAAQKTADAFGLGDVMTKSAVGAHQGQFGLFMEKAPGKEAAKFVAGGQKEVPGSLTVEQIKSLDDEQYGKVIGGIMRKTNRLEWFDILTGQGDRHHHNYLLNVGADGQVSVKGIDNDACFGVFMVGPGRFLLQGDHALVFREMLGNVKKGLYPPEASQAQKTRIDTDPGVRRLENGAFYVDVSQIKAPEIHACLRKATGCHVTGFPQYMDADFHDHLMKMQEGSPDRAAYVGELRKRLPDQAVEAAVLRLDAAIECAKRYKEEGRVIGAEEWSKRDVQRRVAGPLPPRVPDSPDEVLPTPLPRVGGQAPLTNKFANEVVSLASSGPCGLFRRDLMAQLAKPGWFDE